MLSARAGLLIALGGVPGVLIAAYVIKSLPLTAVRWLVILVVLYTSLAMLRSAWKEHRPPAVPHQPPTN